MYNPLRKKYTSIRKAKKAYKKYVAKDFPRWYLYKDKYIKLLRYPFVLPQKWEWLRQCSMFYDFELSVARNLLYWDDEMIDTLHKRGITLL